MRADPSLGFGPGVGLPLSVTFSRNMYHKLCLAVVCALCSLATRAQTVSRFFQDDPQVAVSTGLFTTYKQGQRLYWEIPDTLLGREFVVSLTVLSAPKRPSKGEKDPKWGYAGDMIAPVFFSLEAHGDKLWVTHPQHGRMFKDSTSTFSKLALQTTTTRLYRRLPIIQRYPNSILVEVGQWLKSFPLFSLGIASYDLKLGAKQKQFDKVEKVEVKADRFLFQVVGKYEHRSPFDPKTDADTLSKPDDWRTGVCIALMPRQSIEAVDAYSDAYFRIQRLCFGEGSMPGKRAFVKRWRLEVPHEMRQRYQDGELVEPVRPIIFYVDRQMPPQYRTAVMQAVRNWQPAFEQAGFKNAIDAQLEPVDTANPQFCPYDIAVPFISWKESGFRNAYGPTPCEPRAGEVIGCHIAVFSGVIDLIRNWYFVQCGANDPAGRQPELPDSVTNVLLEMVLTHEVGHSLGLEHNFLGSSHFATDSLRNNDFLTRNGITTSIMDYVRCNYALRPADKVSLRNRIARLGVYDRWAIEWAYRLFPGKDAAERAANRKRWMDKTLADTLLAFCNALDVRAQAEDLGNDPMTVNEQGIANLRLLCADSAIWIWRDSLERNRFRDRHEAMVDHCQNMIVHVLRHLIGRKFAAPTDSLIYVLEHPSVGRSALSFIQRHLWQPPSWLFDARFARLLGIDTKGRSEKFCKELLEFWQHMLKEVDHWGYSEPGRLTSVDMLRSAFATLYGTQTAPMPGILLQNLRKEYRNLLTRLSANEAASISAPLLVEVSKQVEMVCKPKEKKPTRGKRRGK